MIGALHGVSGCCQCCPLRRRLFCGGCSWVEYQRIKLVWHGLYRLCPGASTAACVPFWGCGLCGKLPGRGGVGLCLAHCWVLRQQDLFAAMQRGTSGVSFVPAAGTSGHC